MNECLSKQPSKNQVVLRKHPFLLLEVLIAFAIVAVCILPLIWPHTYILRAQKEFLSEIALDHYVNTHFAEMTELLYKNEIPWEVIEEGRVVSFETGLPYKGTFSFEEIKHKPKEEKPYMFYLFNLNYSFTLKNDPEAAPLKYTYTLFIIRDLPAQLAEPEEEEEK